MLIDPYRYGGGGGGGGGSTDPYFANVSLLLHGNGANGGTTFTDSSVYAASPSTVAGTIVTSTSSPKFGSACIDTGSGLSNYLFYTNGSKFDFSTGDWTIEAWFRASASDTYLEILSHYQVDDAIVPVQFYYSAGNLVVYCKDGSGSIVVATDSLGYSFALNTWHFVELSRSGNNFNLFANGNLRSMVSSSATLYYNPAQRVRVAYGTGSPGQIDDLRVTKGVARHTSNYTPPTAELPNS